MTSDQSAGPLAGIRVLEVGNFIAGPFAGQLLGDYGAEVLKVETPGQGDPMRTWGLTHEGQSLWWPAIARNKKSVAVDLHAHDGRELVRRLARRCDVVLENFRPGRLEEWGLGYGDLAADNPGVIVVHVSGFGRSGPRSGDAGFGSIGEAMGGIRATTGEPDRRSARCGISLGDALAALFAVIGCLAAVTERQRSGIGQEVDVAIYEAVAALMESTLADFEIGGVLRSRTGGVLPGVAPSNSYPTLDGSDVLIAANADSVFVRLCTAMDRPALAEDERFATHTARGTHMTELDELIAAWTHTMPSDDLLALLAAHGVPSGRVYTAEDILDDPHYVVRDLVVRAVGRAGYRVPMAGVVPKFSRTPGAVNNVGPGLGEHTEHVLRTLAGVDDAEWTARGVGHGGMTVVIDGDDTSGASGRVSIAYDRIRRSIVEGSYPPGSRLVEQSLSAELSLSRTPIREALRRLEVEGLVDYRRNRGALVRTTTAQEVADLDELRARLESYAAELAATRSTPEDRQALVEAAGAFDAVSGSSQGHGSRTAEERWALHDANGRFHRAIVTAARHERLLQMLDRTVDVPLVYQALERFEPAELERSALFHRMIARAVSNGEGARAGRLMAEHILLGRDRLLAPAGHEGAGDQ